MAMYVYSTAGEPVGFLYETFIHDLEGRPLGRIIGSRVHRLARALSRRAVQGAGGGTPWRPPPRPAVAAAPRDRNPPPRGGRLRLRRRLRAALRRRFQRGRRVESEPAGR